MKHDAVGDIKRFIAAPPGHVRVVEHRLDEGTESLLTTFQIFQKGRAYEEVDECNKARKNKHIVYLAIDERGVPIYGLGQLLKPESETVREPVGATFQPAIA
jgi:hypothetical protein